MFFTTVIAVATALYVFATRAVRNEPLKSNISGVISRTDNYLITLSEIKSFEFLSEIGKLALRLFFSSLILFLVINLIYNPSDIQELNLYIGIIFSTSILVKFSVDYHIKKEGLFKSWFSKLLLLALLFFPTLVTITDHFLGKNAYDLIFGNLLETSGIASMVNLQLIWGFAILVTCFVIPYLISLMVFLALYASAKTYSFVIRFTSKYISNRILDVFFAAVVAFKIYDGLTS